MNAIQMQNQKVFDINVENNFSSLSGDFNPIHINEQIARRELFGEIIVHGIHLLEIPMAHFGLNHFLCHTQKQDL